MQSANTLRHVPGPTESCLPNLTHPHSKERNVQTGSKKTAGSGVKDWWVSCDMGDERNVGV